MAWRDRLQRASFRGIDFWVDSHSHTAGRRVAVRHLPGKDESVNQDLGRNSDELDVDAFLWGEDYDLLRDDLVAALVEPGPAALILPTRGELWVRITRGPVTLESKNEGGYCRVRFSAIVEDRNAGRLKAKPDTAMRLKKTAANVRAAAKTDFNSVFNVLGMPSKYVNSAKNAIGSVTTTARSVQGKLNGTLNGIEDVTASITNFDQAVTGLLSTPSALAAGLTGLVNSVIALATNSAKATRQAFKGYAGLGSLASGIGATLLADRDAKNVQAVYRLSRAEALATAAETYATVALDTSTTALGIVEEVTAEIDALGLFGPSAELYASLQDLRAALTEHMVVTSGKLPSTVVVEQKTEIPALLFAYMFYGDPSRAAEVIARNRTPDPLFLRGLIEVVDR